MQKTVSVQQSSREIARGPLQQSAVSSMAENKEQRAASAGAIREPFHLRRNRPPHDASLIAAAERDMAQRAPEQKNERVCV